MEVVEIAKADEGGGLDGTILDVAELEVPIIEALMLDPTVLEGKDDPKALEETAWLLRLWVPDMVCDDMVLTITCAEREVDLPVVELCPLTPTTVLDVAVATAPEVGEGWPAVDPDCVLPLFAYPVDAVLDIPPPAVTRLGLDGDWLDDTVFETPGPTVEVVAGPALFPELFADGDGRLGGDDDEYT